MVRMIPADRPAYVAVARYAPLGFLAAVVFFAGLVVVSIATSEMDWLAFAVLVTLLPGLIVSLMGRELVGQLLREASVEDRTRSRARH